MKLQPGDPIPSRWRQNAARQLAAKIDKWVVILSRYGQPIPKDAPVQRDEDMAYSGLADLLGCWWQLVPADEFEKRLTAFCDAIRTARSRRITPDGETVH